MRNAALASSALAPLLLLALAGCGAKRTAHEDQRSRDSVVATDEGDQSPGETPTETATVAAPSAPAAAVTTPKLPIVDLPEISDEEVSTLVYDESIDRTVRAAYSQNAADLSDLFADPANPQSSMLCWPAALAYQMHHLRTKAEAPLSRLPDETVRGFADICGTDPRTGTTVPQGAACIAKHLASASYDLDLQVIGVDAQWSLYGMYPQGTLAEQRSVSASDLRKALQADRGVILFIGYYRLDEVVGSWQRVGGHFVSASGFGYRKAWGDDEMTLRVVNPAVDYSTRDRPSSGIKLRRLTPPAVTKGLPANADLKLDGASIGPTELLPIVESAVVFAARAAG